LNVVPFPGFTIYPDAAARALRDAEHDRQAEPRPFPDLLGREKGLEDASLHLRFHAHAGVTDGEHDMRPRLRAQMHGRIALIQLDGSGLDRQLAAPRHGVAGIQRQVHDHLFDVARVSQHAPQLRCKAGNQVHVFSQDAAQHPVHHSHRLIQIDRLRRDDLLSAEHQQLSSKIGGAQRGLAYLCNIAARGVRRAQFRRDQITVAEDDG
jgi:hypothetical protein